jgi:hypothetical protein
MPFQICPSCRELVDVVEGKWTACDECKAKLTYDPGSKRAAYWESHPKELTEFEQMVDDADAGKIAERIIVSHHLGKRGAHVCITGVVPSMTRQQAFARLSELGYVPQQSVTSTTDVLIVCPNNRGIVETTKVKAAQRYGAEVVQIDDVIELFGAVAPSVQQLADRVKPGDTQDEWMDKTKDDSGSFEGGTAVVAQQMITLGCDSGPHLASLQKHPAIVADMMSRDWTNERNDFISSVYRQWRLTGRLTDKQAVAYRRVVFGVSNVAAPVGQDHIYEGTVVKATFSGGKASILVKASDGTRAMGTLPDKVLAKMETVMVDPINELLDATISFTADFRRGDANDVSFALFRNMRHDVAHPVSITRKNHVHEFAA